MSAPKWKQRMATRRLIVLANGDTRRGRGASELVVPKLCREHFQRVREELYLGAPRPWKVIECADLATALDVVRALPVDTLVINWGRIIPCDVARSWVIEFERARPTLDIVSVAHEVLPPKMEDWCTATATGERWQSGPDRNSLYMSIENIHDEIAPPNPIELAPPPKDGRKMGDLIVLDGGRVPN
jgi:hypothetical protein